MLSNETDAINTSCFASLRMTKTLCGAIAQDVGAKRRLFAARPVSLLKRRNATIECQSGRHGPATATKLAMHFVQLGCRHARLVGGINVQVRVLSDEYTLHLAVIHGRGLNVIQSSDRCSRTR